MMKYAIKRRRLPQARLDQVYTLTIFMGYLGKDASTTREAKVQYPVSSHREGLCKYRELRRMQRLLDEQSLPTTALRPQPVGLPQPQAVPQPTMPGKPQETMPVAV